MRFPFAHLFALVLLLAPAALSAQMTSGTEANTATWGNILWIVLIVVAAAGSIALAMLALRSSTKQ